VQEASLYNPTDPGVRLLARAVQGVPPRRVALVYCGPLPGLGPGATRWAIDVREQDAEHPAIVAAPAEVPIDQRFDAAVVWPRAHLGKDFSEACIALAGSVLAPGGRLYCAVRKDKGGPSLARTIAELCGSVETAERDRGYHLYVAEKTARFDEAAARAAIHARYEIAEPLLGETPLLSAPGVFSRKRLDDGSRALLQALQAARLPAPRRVIDLGAGLGPLGLWAARTWPEVHVLAVESNAIAARLVRENAERLGCAGRVEALLSDGLPAAHPSRGGFDLALVNPPTHAPPEAFAALVSPLASWLRPGAEAWFVVNRSGRLLQILQESRASVDAREVPGFWIVRARWG
jgi:16S rRNA G1207 methylase RsmC